MSNKKNQLKLEEKIMSQVKTGQIKMKPRWYFVVGSISLLSGIIALGVGVMFLVNLIVFTLRGRGPMVSWKLQMMLENFPWWIPVLAVVGVVLGINLLRKYDFSYQKNFRLIAVSFVLAILVAGFMIDRLGLNDHWSRRDHMKQIYQRLELRNEPMRPHRRLK